MKRYACCAAVIAIVATPTFAGPACTQRTTAGNWAARCEGELPAPPSGAPALTRLLATCTATREGVFTCAGTANLGGAIVVQTLVGTAQNEPDCTGFIHYEQTFNGQPAPPLDITYVISDSGDQIWGLPLNSGGVLACTLQRITRDRAAF